MATNDLELVRQYAVQQSENAFAALVSRHTNLVYSTSLRLVHNPQLAEEVTQAVFIILARKAGSFDEKTILPSWLYRTACFVSGSALKQEHRRQQREQEAYMQSTLNEAGTEAAWKQLSPLLEEAMLRLGHADRDALVLRFFEGHTLHEVGAALGTSEDAAKKRVNRAVERLRKFFTRRGVVLPAAVLTTAISANSIQAAPVTLAKTATAVAFTGGATASGSTLTLIKGVLKVMAWTKAKTAIVVGVGILLAVGTVTVSVKEVTAVREENSWRVPNFKRNVLDQVAPQVRILPTKFHDDQRNGEFGSNGRKIGIAFPLDYIVCFAYGWLPGRIIFESGDPQKEYDYIANLPQGSMPALQRELKDQLGLVAQPEARDTDVLLLKVKIPGASGLKPPLRSRKMSDAVGHFHCDNEPLSTPDLSSVCLVSELEAYFGVPVVNQTGLTQNFCIDLMWNEAGQQDPGHDALKQALLNQLGLELVPGHEPIQMLIVKKTN